MEVISAVCLTQTSDSLSAELQHLFLQAAAFAYFHSWIYAGSLWQRLTTSHCVTASTHSS